MCLRVLRHRIEVKEKLTANKRQFDEMAILPGAQMEAHGLAFAHDSAVVV